MGSSSGALREGLQLSGSGPAEVSPRDLSFEGFLGFVEAVLSVELGPVGPESAFSSTGLDSLDMFELATAMEHCAGRDLPEELIDSWQTLGDVWGWWQELS